MSFRGVRRPVVAALVCGLGFSGAAVAQADEGRGIDPAQGLDLVEVELPNKAAAMALQLRSEQLGVEFNDHYLRYNRNGTVTVSVFGDDEGLESLEAAGYDVTRIVESEETWEKRIAERETAVQKENRAEKAAESNKPGNPEQSDEIVVLRVDYFENYSGRFLSVEAKNRLGTSTPTGAQYQGPTMEVGWNRGGKTEIDQGPRLMGVNIDPDTNPDTYIEHRVLIRIGDYSEDDPPAPNRIRIGSSTGESIEADVKTWLGGVVPPMPGNFLSDFTTRYMDPTEVYERFDELAAEFPNLSELITLPYETNGYQRKAQATMNGSAPIGNTATGTAATQAVVLTARAWGHEGGNDITAEFVNPGVPDSPLSVTAVGNDITVSLGTNASGALSSTAAQVVQAINSSAAASQLVVALTYRGNAGAGIVQPRARVNLSDFLTTATNAHVPRGPFEYSVMRIGKHRDGSKTGVFLYCQQHAREWVTPLTCLETAEQLLRNYAINGRVKQLVDNLDIFILPSSNPDGSHYSIHNFASQRRNMTNWCVNGAKEDDDPFAANYWTPRINPGNGQPYVNSDPASRNAWGVDLNRNNTVGTIFDSFNGLGYIGASHSCTSDVFAGPAEASEPEIRNELWIADTFTNIKFSNNIHSFGGYFMWAPGAYLSNRDEGDLVHPNIGVETYFFEAGDRILNRIKEVRGSVILPARTGPIADVLYSAGGNSADEHWYERGVIAYSFETGADRFVNTSLQQPSAEGATAIRLANRTGFAPGDKITIDAGNDNEEVRTVETVINPNPANPNPNVILTEPLSLPHAQGAPVAGGITQQSVGFQPNYANEGKPGALEFTAGNFGLLESALDYEKDYQKPQVRMTGAKASSEPIVTTFEYINEPSVIRYTMDGSTPDENSALWDSTGPREPGQTFTVTETTTFRWRAEDIKGNVSYGKETFTIQKPKN